MKKIALMIVAAAAVCAAVPASAQTVVVRDGMHRGPGFHHRGPVYRSRAEYRRPFVRRPYVRRGGPAIVIRP